MAARVVRPGGLVCGHDYEHNFDKASKAYSFGVHRAVQEFRRHHEHMVLVAKGMDGLVSYCLRKAYR